MFTLKSSESLYNFTVKTYFGTSASTGHYGFILNALEKFDVPFGEVMIESLTRGSHSVKTMETCIKNLYSVGNKVGLEFGDEYRKEFYLIAEAATNVPTTPSREVSARLERSNAKDTFMQVKSPVGRAVLCLAYTAGLTPNDLLREKMNLDGLKDGKAVIGARLDKGNTAPRTVNFDPSMLNELDPEGELIQVIRRLVAGVTSSNAGLKGLCLGHYYAGSGYTIHDLRNSHALDLLKDGYLAQEVAEIQGVKKNSLEDRLRKFRDKLNRK